MYSNPHVVAAAVLLVVSAVGCSKPPSKEVGTASDTAAAAPKVTTDSPVGAAELRATNWLLVAVGDKPVTVTDSNRAAHIILQPDSKQVAGSGGCNRMFGTYELNSDALRFSGIRATKMACKDGMDTEAAFLPVLLRVNRWKISGKQLELSDSAGVVLARFEARK
jgi:heat shock protein HslJ